jgi:hypothetical protein
MKASVIARQCSFEKRRHRRRRVWLSAVLIAPEAEAAVYIRDISCKGAMIETDAELRVGCRAILLRKGLETPVTVAWIHAPHIGLVFEEAFSEKDLVEYSLPRAPRSKMRQAHGFRRTAQV